MRISDWSSDVVLFRSNDDERSRAHKWGIEDLDKVYDLNDLAKGDCIFAATGVTDGSLLEGVKRLRGGKMTTESVVMRASSGTVRWVKGEHRIQGEGPALCRSEEHTSELQSLMRISYA